MKKTFIKIKKEIIKRRELITLFITFGFFTILILLRTNAITNRHSFLETYKFFSSDGYDWLVNGIYYFKDKSITYRSPGLPILIKVLFSTKLVWLLPYINGVAFIALILAINRSVKFLTKSCKIAILVSVLMFFNFELLEFSKYILADIYAILFISVALYFTITNKLSIAFLFLGFSALFQNFAYFLFALWMLVTFVDFILRRYSITHKIKLLKEVASASARYILMFLLPLLPVMIYKVVAFGNPMYTALNQVGLLEINFDSISYYALSILDIYTFPLLLLAFIAGVYYVKDRKQTKYKYILSGLAITLFFWVLVYDWNDKRFMLYLIPFIFLMAGDGFKYLLIIFRNHKDIRGSILSTAIILILALGMTPAPSFFTANELVILPNLKVEWGVGYEDGYGVYIKRDYMFRQYSYRETAEQLPLIRDFMSYKTLRDDLNLYAVYGSAIDQRLSSDETEFCINSPAEFDMYSLKSILKIRRDIDINNIQIRECDL